MNPLRITTLGAGALAAATLLVAAPAAAQKTDGKVQFGLSAPIAGYHSYKVDQSGADNELSGILWGLPNTQNAIGNPTVTFELGYGIGKMAVMGLLFRAGGGSLKVQPESGVDEDRQNFGFDAGPKLDFVFSSGKDLRPFLGLAGGYSAVWTSADVTGAPNRESSTKGYFVTGRFGFHSFAASGFSVDPMLVFNYRKADETADEGVGAAVDVERTYSGFDVGLALGLSGWM